MNRVRNLQWHLTAALTAQRGQTMAEYALLLGIIALVVITAAVFLGGSISSIFRDTGSHL